MLADVAQCGPKIIHSEGGKHIDIFVGNFIVVTPHINDDAGDGVGGCQGSLPASRDFFVCRQWRWPFEDVVVKDE
jgi:hypothetical protein